MLTIKYGLDFASFIGGRYKMLHHIRRAQQGHRATKDRRDPSKAIDYNGPERRSGRDRRVE